MKFIKSVAMLAAVAGFAFVAQAGSAEARCVDCNMPVAKTNVKTVHQTRTVRQVRDVTRVRHVEKKTYVKNLTRVVTKTVVVPVTRVNTVTRVHNRTFVINQTQHVRAMARAPGRTVAGWSRTETVNHRPVHVSCGCR
jgi:hypothetical protein